MEEENNELYSQDTDVDKPAVPDEIKEAASPLPASQYTVTEPVTVRNEPCMICTDDMIDDDLYFLQCFHKFHTKCISRWLTVKQQCPICKFPANIDIIGVDEHGSFITATGHTITNGIIEDREAIMQESMDTRISRAIDLLREMHSQQLPWPVPIHPPRRRPTSLQVNVRNDSDTDSSDSDERITDTEAENSLSPQMHWPATARHDPINFDNQFTIHESTQNTDSQEGEYRTFGPIEDETVVQWANNVVEESSSDAQYFSQTTPLLSAITEHSQPNIITQAEPYLEVQLSQPRTPSPYPLFWTNRYSAEQRSVAEYVQLGNHASRQNHSDGESSDFTYDSDGDTDTN